MSLLYALEGLRTGVGNLFFLLVTYLGTEGIALLLLLVIFWCVDRRTGFYMIYSTLFGICVVQVLKVVFMAPRPWTADPYFTAVEAAKSTAGGYSFPSGHVAKAVCLYGSAAWYTKKKWVCILSGILVALIFASRLYLGVHTFSDVLTSLILGAVIVLILYPLCRRAEITDSGFLILQVVFLLWILGSFFYINWWGNNRTAGFSIEEMSAAADTVTHAYETLGAS